MPILPARGGHFRAVNGLSPLARSRVTPLFDVPAVMLKEGKTFEAYLAARVEGIHGCWGSKRPVYVDVHDLPLDLRTDSGAQPIAHLVDLMRKRGLRPIPCSTSPGGVSFL